MTGKRIIKNRVKYLLQILSQKYGSMFYYCGPAAAECVRNNQITEEAIVSQFLIYFCYMHGSIILYF